MIAREHVEDLRVGDVVELTDERWPLGTTLRGPLYSDGNGCLALGHLPLKDSMGGLYIPRPHSTLTVIERARRLYVNHPRTRPVAGDVMRRDSDENWRLFGWSGGKWVLVGGTFQYGTKELDPPFRLLVDGETGQVVP